MATGECVRVYQYTMSKQSGNEWAGPHRRDPPRTLRRGTAWHAAGAYTRPLFSST